MCENDLRKEILQSTQRLMCQIDQIKPIEINPEEIEKSQAFIHQIESEQIQNIEKSNSLLRDVTDWGDKRKDQYDEFEKPLLRTVEKSVHDSEEVAKSAIPLLQEKINNYDRRIGDLKSSIASMSDAITKTAKETYDTIKNGNDSSSKIEENTPFFQFSLTNLSQNDNNNAENIKGDSQQTNSDGLIDSDTSYDIIQSMKLREEHLLNVVRSLSNELKTLKNSIKSEQSLSRNFHFELEYIKSHTYSPSLSIDSEALFQYEQIKNYKLEISSNNSNYVNFYYEKPLIVIEYKNQNENTENLEEQKENNENSAQKITIYQDFEVCDIRPNEDLLKDHIFNKAKTEYYQNLRDQSSQKEDANLVKNEVITRNNIEHFEVADISSNFLGFYDNIGEVTITKEEGDNHHIFNYSENMNSEQAADDLDELISFHRSCQNGEKEYEEDSNDNNGEDQLQQDENIDENDMKLQKIKIITDFKHAAYIVYNSKTGKREIITENNIRLELTPTNSSNNDLDSYNFTSANGQHLNVILLDQNNNEPKNDIKINLSSDEIVENKAIYITNEKSENGEEIKLQVIINKDGESYVTNNDSENNTRMFLDSNGRTFIYDSANSVQIPVVMNDTGQIMYEMSNSEFIQVAMMNIQSELFYINEEGHKMLMHVDENGNFYVLSSSGQRIPIDIFKHLNTNDQKSTENINGTQQEEQDQQENADAMNYYNNQIENHYDHLCDSDRIQNNQYLDSNNFAQDRLVPVSISRKDNELKIIYKDNEDAVVVNTSISHTTQGGQMILRPNTTIDQKPKQIQGLDSNFAIKGVKFKFNDSNPETRITRIVGGFNKSFVRQSRRKRFNWTVRPSWQVVKLNIVPKPPRCYYHQPAKERHISNSNNSNEPQTTPSTAKEVNKNTSLRWIAFPVRPPPLYCRKGTHLDLSVTGISTITGSSKPITNNQLTATTNQTKETQSNNSQYQNISNDHSEKIRYQFNKKKIVQPESNINKFKIAHDHTQFKSEQSQRKIYNNASRNQKSTVSPSPRRQLQHQRMKRLNPLAPSLPPQISVQPSPRIKYDS